MYYLECGLFDCHEVFVDLGVFMNLLGERGGNVDW